MGLLSAHGSIAWRYDEYPVMYESITGNTAFGVEIVRSVLQSMGHDCEAWRYSLDNRVKNGFQAITFR